MLPNQPPNPPHPPHRRAISKHAQQARALRTNSTGPEKVLWRHLRGSQLADLKFRRQHPLPPYVVDFYCHEVRLAVELDGDSHDQARYNYDMDRQRYLEDQGVIVFRIANDDVLRDVESVLMGILKMVAQLKGEEVEKTGQRKGEKELSEGDVNEGELSKRDISERDITESEFIEREVSGQKLDERDVSGEKVETLTPTLSQRERELKISEVSGGKG